MRTSSKLHFVDPALAATIIGASVERLVQDLGTAGLWFESQAVQHLRTLAELRGGRVYHDRDKSEKEVDAVVEFADGALGCFRGQTGSAAGTEGTGISCRVRGGH